MKQRYVLLDMRTREAVASVFAASDTEAAAKAVTFSEGDQRLVAMRVKDEVPKPAKKRKAKNKHEPPLPE